MRQQRRGGGFAVGAGDADEARAGAGAADGLIQKFHIGNDRDAGGDRSRGDWMRLRESVRNAGGKHDGVEVQIALAQVAQVQISRRGAGGFVVIPGGDVGSHREQRRGGGPAVLTQSDDGEFLAGEYDGGKRSHGIALFTAALIGSSGSRGRPAPGSSI